MEKLKERLLAFFFEEPEKEFYVRELAKLLKKSPTTISKYLSSLEKSGLLISFEKFGRLFFKSNLTGGYGDLKIYYNLKKIRESGLVSFLENEFNFPNAIVLFGSFSKAENIKGSDIDILIVSPVKKESDLKIFEKKLGAEIQLFRYSKEEIKSMKNKELLNNFINGIVLSGYMEV